MAKPDEDLQRLVWVIERKTRDSNVLVESPKRLPDKDTGRLREHDVVLTYTQPHHKLLVALKCRDRPRKVGVREVEAFHSKCERTRIDRGIMVSSIGIGFTPTARKKAASYSIDCLGLDEATMLNWRLVPGRAMRQSGKGSVELGVQDRRSKTRRKSFDVDRSRIGIVYKRDDASFRVMLWSPEAERQRRYRKYATTDGDFVAINLKTDELDYILGMSIKEIGQRADNDTVLRIAGILTRCGSLLLRKALKRMIEDPCGAATKPPAQTVGRRMPGRSRRRKLIPSSAARANPRGPAAEVADTAVGKAVSRGRQT
jgi:hypothetical protein